MVEVSQMVLVDTSKPFMKEEERLFRKIERVIKVIESETFTHFMDKEEARVESYGDVIDCAIAEDGSPMWLAFKNKEGKVK